MNPIDLNIEEPALAEPFRCEIEPTLGGLACIGSGTVKCKIELDRGGEKETFYFILIVELNLILISFFFIFGLIRRLCIR